MGESRVSARETLAVGEDRIFGSSQACKKRDEIEIRFFKFAVHPGRDIPKVQKQLRVDPGTDDLLRALLTSPMMSLPVSKGEGSGELTVTTTGTSHLSTPA